MRRREDLEKLAQSRLRREQEKERRVAQMAEAAKARAARQAIAAIHTPVSATIESKGEALTAPKAAPDCKTIARLVGRASVPFFVDEDSERSAPSTALQHLADLYLHAAANRTRHVILTWPATLRTFAVGHLLATLERWQDGDKRGIRGLVYPVKTNAFHLLNHIHLSREAVLAHARRLLEGRDRNNAVTRGFPDKDAYLFSLARIKELNPTAGELLPHFLAGEDFQDWASCEKRLLSHISARLERRLHAKALRENCSVVGDPHSAPDALFAIDGRLANGQLKRAMRRLRDVGEPEVVVVLANRFVREEAKSWKTRLAKFCKLIDETFTAHPPGILVLTDQPLAIVQFKQAIAEQMGHSAVLKFQVSAVPCITGEEGLLDPGAAEPPMPMPRELEVEIVDGEAARVINRFWQVTQRMNVAEQAAPIHEAARFIGRLAALPCGLAQVSAHLSSHDFSERARTEFDWNSYLGALREFDRRGGCPDARDLLIDAMDEGTRLVADCSSGTPFAHLLAKIVFESTRGSGRATVVFTTGFNRLLGEGFLRSYAQYPDGAQFDSFGDRVAFVTPGRLGAALSQPGHGRVVFAGLNEEALRIAMSDNRVPPHSALLLTQNAAQFLRMNLRMLVDDFPELKVFKPRMESILRQLQKLPDAKRTGGMISATLELAPLRLQLSSDPGQRTEEEDDPNAWAIHLDSGVVLYRTPSHKMHVYEPASQYASDRSGFKPCEVRTLEAGDKVFVMTPELRDMVDDVLTSAGVPMQSDLGYEAGLRSYHEQVVRRLNDRFPGKTLAEQVRKLRAAIFGSYPNLEADFPREETTRHWINLGASPNTPFDQLRPQAPGKEAYFKAFAETLGMSALEIAIHWARAIQPIRNSRRLYSRQLSDMYEHMLLNQESVMVHSNIPRATLKTLFNKARETVATVTAIDQRTEK